MRRLTILLLALFAISLFAEDAEAWPFRRRGRTVTTYRAAVTFSGTDQERAYQEAKYMHENRVYRHVGGTIGYFEGFGIGGPNCATCTPNRPMTLTADAHYGNVRVRAWR